MPQNSMLLDNVHRLGGRENYNNLPFACVAQLKSAQHGARPTRAAVSITTTQETALVRFTGVLVLIQQSATGEHWHTAHEKEIWKASTEVILDLEFCLPFLKVTVRPFGQAGKPGLPSKPRPKVKVNVHLCSNGPIAVTLEEGT